MFHKMSLSMYSECVKLNYFLNCCDLQHFSTPKITFIHNSTNVLQDCDIFYLCSPTVGHQHLPSYHPHHCVPHPCQHHGGLLICWLILGAFAHLLPLCLVQWSHSLSRMLSTFVLHTWSDSHQTRMNFKLANMPTLLVSWFVLGCTPYDVLQGDRPFAYNWDHRNVGGVSSYSVIILKAN